MSQNLIPSIFYYSVALIGTIMVAIGGTEFLDNLIEFLFDSKTTLKQAFQYSSDEMSIFIVGIIFITFGLVMAKKLK